MAATKFGIVYSVGSGIIRRYIYPSLSNTELDNVPLGLGEAIAIINNGPFANSAAWQAAVNNAIQSAIGKATGSPRCCVIDQTGNVVGVIMADPMIDSVDGMTLVSNLSAGIGWTWTTQGGFVAPLPNLAKGLHG